MRTLAALALPALLLAGCGRPDHVRVTHAWVRLSALPDHPAAAYFTLEGGRTPATLVSVSSPQARDAQMHQSKMAGGMMTMAPLARVAVPPGGQVRFAPEGNHVMLFGVSPAVRPGGNVRLVFTFGDHATLTADARAVAAGDPDPQA